MVYLAVGILFNVVLVAMFLMAIRLLRDPSPKALARRQARLEKKNAKRLAKAEKAGITLDDPMHPNAVPANAVPANAVPANAVPANAVQPNTAQPDTMPTAPAAEVPPALAGPTPDSQPMLANTIVVQPSAAAPAPEPIEEPAQATKRRFVPGGPLMEDGSVPDFSLSVSHLFVKDNGVKTSTRRRSTIDPIKLSIQAGARPVTPLLERVVQAMIDIGLEPAQARPLVHSFMDTAGRSARVRLGHSAALGDLIEIEIEPSLSPAAMASVMQLLAELDFDPSDAPSAGRSAKG